ncbi:MAG TPA: hypothetical protein VGR50_04610 [Terriglobales bacterium]|nr:hypothetical protein [Terriglobales bacterium]
MRLGDTIEDYCSRCKLNLDHSVVAMNGDEVLHVRCRTCNGEHKYRKNRSGKKQMTAQEAFNKVLASVTAHQPASGKKK